MHPLRSNILVSIPLAVLLAVAAGCSTSSDNEMDPADVPARTDIWPEPPPVAGARNTGTFPNLNEIPRAANRQLTPEETQAKLAELEAAKRAQRPPGSRETEEQRRRRLKLLADRQADTLRVIENQ